MIKLLLTCVTGNITKNKILESYVFTESFLPLMIPRTILQILIVDKILFLNFTLFHKSILDSMFINPSTELFKIHY